MAKTKTILVLGRKFRILIDWELDTASGRFLKYQYPVSSEQIDDFMAMHYENKTGRLIGFTIIHLKEFTKMVKKAISNHIQRRKREERELLREKAQQAVYESISGKEWVGVLSIPEPFWHKKDIERFSLMH